MNRVTAGLLSALLIAITAGVSQGQASNVDSLDASTVHDSARVGSLVYRAATKLTYPKRDPNKPGDVEGDLTTVVSILNTGSARSEVSLSRCALRIHAFLRPDYKLYRGIPGLASATACVGGDQRISLAPRKTREITLVSRNWKHGGNGWLGPLNFVAELQLHDTSVLLASGKSAITSSLAGLEYQATTKLEGSAPSRVVGTVTISNRGELPAQIEFGACAVDLFAFRSADRTGEPQWDSNPGKVCILIGYGRQIAPGYSTSLTAIVPTHDMLHDRIPGGRYFFRAQVELNRQKFTMDAGSLTISGTNEPLPASRTADSISFSSSVKRITYGSSVPDSLEVMFIARNESHVPRTIRPVSRCIGIMGFKSRDHRDISYARPAYENDWYVRPCQIPALPFDVVPGRVHVSYKRIAAPAEPMFYTLFLEFSDDTFPTRESYFVDLAADETANM